MKRILISAAMLAMSGVVQADNQLNLAINVTSFHFPRQDFNERNPGIGLEYGNSEVKGMIGTYDNSYYRRTNYLLGAYTPLHYGNINAGVFGGLASGYAYPVVGGLILNYQGSMAGVNLMIVPSVVKNASSVIGVQLTIKL